MNSLHDFPPFYYNKPIAKTYRSCISMTVLLIEKLLLSAVKPYDS